MAEKTENKAGRAKGVQIQATVPVEVREALNDYRFANRIEKFSDVVTIALTEFVAAHPAKA